MIIIKFQKGKQYFRVVVKADPYPFVEVETVDVDALGTAVSRWTRASGFDYEAVNTVIRRAFLAYGSGDANAAVARWARTDTGLIIDLGPIK